MTPDDAACAWLTTLRRDGSPHTTPVWFLWDGGTFWIASSTVNVKVRNIRRDPRVSIAIDGSGQRPYIAQGDAVIHESFDEHLDLVAGFADKYLGWDATDESQDGPRVLLEINVERWLLRPQDD